MFKTLLVEDDDEFRGMLRRLLWRRFPALSLSEAGDGWSALQSVVEASPDLVLMDIKLPGLNGLTVTKEIKDWDSGIVVVILTSYDFPEYRQQAFRNGADCFICKSSETSTDDLLARVEGSMLRKSRLPASHSRPDYP